jgi:hypothetical protein
MGWFREFLARMAPRKSVQSYFQCNMNFEGMLSKLGWSGLCMVLIQTFLVRMPYCTL